MHFVFMFPLEIMQVLIFRKVRGDYLSGETWYPSVYTHFFLGGDRFQSEPRDQIWPYIRDGTTKTGEDGYVICG